MSPSQGCSVNQVTNDALCQAILLTMFKYPKRRYDSETEILWKTNREDKIASKMLRDFLKLSIKSPILNGALHTRLRTSISSFADICVCLFLH